MLSAISCYQEQVCVTFQTRPDKPFYKFFSIEPLSAFVTGMHCGPFKVDETFKPTRLVDLFPDYELPEDICDAIL